MNRIVLPLAQLVVSSVANALDDSESLLHKALSTALKVGVVMPGRVLLKSPARERSLSADDRAPQAREERRA